MDEDKLVPILLEIKGEIGDLKGDLGDLKGQIGHVRGECDFFPQMRIDLTEIVRTQAIIRTDLGWLKKTYWIVVSAAVGLLVAVGTMILQRR